MVVSRISAGAACAMPFCWMPISTRLDVNCGKVRSQLAWKISSMKMSTTDFHDRFR